MQRKGASKHIVPIIESYKNISFEEAANTKQISANVCSNDTDQRTYARLLVGKSNPGWDMCLFTSRLPLAWLPNDSADAYPDVDM